MSIQNLGLQESVGVKYIDGTYTKFFLSSGLKETGILLNGFKCDAEIKFQTITS